MVSRQASTCVWNKAGFSHFPRLSGYHCVYSVKPKIQDEQRKLFPSCETVGGHVEGSQEFAYPVYKYFVELLECTACVRGTGGHCYKPYGPYITGVSAVSWQEVSGCWTLPGLSLNCHWFCLCCSWIWRHSREKKSVQSSFSVIFLFLLQMPWFCWLHQTVTSSRSSPRRRRDVWTALLSRTRSIKRMDKFTVNNKQLKCSDSSGLIITLNCVW